MRNGVFQNIQSRRVRGEEGSLCSNVLLLLIVFSTFMLSGVANSTTLSSDAILLHGSLPLNPYVSVLYGVPKEHSLDEALALKRQGKFKPLAGDAFNEGLTDTAAWVSFTLDGKELVDTSLNLYLLIGNAALTHIELFMNGKHYGEYPELGHEYSFTQRPIDQPEFIVPIRLEVSETAEFMIKIHSTATLGSTLSLFTEKGFLNKQMKKQFVLGAYYGLIFIMCAYYFLVFGNTQEKVYLYFSASLASLIALELQIDGYLFQYLYPNNPEVSFSMYVALVAGVYVFAFAFAREFLSTRQTDRIIDRGFQWLTYGGLFLAVSGLLLPQKAVYIYGVPFCLVASSVCLLAGFNSISKGYRSGYFYLAAIGAVTVGSTVYIAMVVGLLPVNWFTQSVLKFTTTIEVLLLSFALTDRIRVIRAEKEAIKDSMVQTLKEQNRSKDEFLAIVSHELRTPMNGVQGALDLVQNQPLSTDVREYIEMASASSENMVTLINDILDFTELENHDAKIKSSVFSLKKDVSKLFQRYKGMNKNDDVEYQLTVANNVDEFYKGDSQKIFKVIKHVVNNAVKFTEKGRISIHLSADKENSSDGRAVIQISVRDTGCGIADDKKATIFDSFRQGDGSLSRPKGGAGLGLAITQRLLKSLDGKLNFTSVIGEGSEFVVNVELATVTSNEIKGDAANVLNPDQTPVELYVLVVEDNIVNQKVLAGILNKLGHKTCIANNGQEGVDIVASTAVDLVLMDCQMPVMDGLQATREIRKIERCRGLPIIAVTANAMSEDEALCLDAGMNDFMAKPVNRGAIKRIVEKWGVKQRSGTLSVISGIQ